MESTKPTNEERKCLMFDREGKSGLTFKQGSQGRAVVPGQSCALRESTEHKHRQQRSLPVCRYSSFSEASHLRGDAGAQSPETINMAPPKIPGETNSI